MVPQGRDYFVIIHPLFVVFTTAILFSAQLLLDCKIDYLTLLLCPILIMVNLGLQFSSPFLETVKRHSPFTKPALVAYSNLKLSKNNYMAQMPVLSGSLVADCIAIHGSDLVHNEGRILGNYMAIFIQCTTIGVRKALIEKLEPQKKISFSRNDHDKLIEITDSFDVRWILQV